jgi:hypothetical protein
LLAHSRLCGHDELVRRTQELFDTVAIGNQGPWKQYFAEDAMYFDEKGHSMDKPALVADIKPLPKGYSTHDRRLLDEWMSNWSDLVDFEVHPVVTSKEAAEKIAPRL